MVLATINLVEIVQTANIWFDKLLKRIKYTDEISWFQN